MDQAVGSSNTPVVVNPITSGKSAIDLAELQVPAPESREGDLMRNKGSNIDLNALYQQSQQQQPAFGFNMMMPMMSAGGGHGGMPIPGGHNIPSSNNFAGNQNFYIGSPTKNGSVASSVGKTMGVESGMFSSSNVRPTRIAPQPPQLNVNSPTNPINLNSVQPPNLNQFEPLIIPQTMTNGQHVFQQQQMTTGSNVAFSMAPSTMSPKMPFQDPFQNQATFPPGPAFMDSGIQNIPNLAGSTPNLTIFSSSMQAEPPMVDPSIMMPGQTLTLRGDDTTVNASTTNQLAIGGGLNIRFPKSMSTSSLRTNLSSSITEPGPVSELSQTPGSGDLPLNSSPSSSTLAAAVEPCDNNKRFAAFHFLQRNSAIVDKVIKDEDESSSKGNKPKDVVDGLEPISIPDEHGVTSNITVTLPSGETGKHESENETKTPKDKEDNKENIGKPI